MAENGRKKGQDQFLLALAAGNTITAAAERAGISERQAFRRVEDSGFRRELSRLRAKAFDRATGRLADGAVEAADTLRTLLSVEAPSVRLAAAKALLELACKYRETLDYDERLQRLEELIDDEREQAPAGRAVA